MPPDRTFANPWVTLTARRVYENRWIAFDAATVRDPIGQITSYATVHCKSRSVAIVPIDQNGCTYLIGQNGEPIGIPLNYGAGVSH